MFRPEYLVKIDNTSDIKDTLECFLQKYRFDGLITNVISEQNKREMINQEISEHQKCFTRSPLVLPASQWLHNVYPSIKIDNNLDSTDDEIRRNYELKLIQEINYNKHIKHLGIHYIRNPSCKPETLGKFLLSQQANLRFVVEIALNSFKSYAKVYRSDLPHEDDDLAEDDDPWHYWNALHKATNYSTQVEVAIFLTADLPSNELKIYRWLGEPIAMLVVPHSCFISNKSNYPVLMKQQQDVVRMFMQYTKCIVAIEPKSINDNRIDHYLEYLKYQSNFLEPEQLGEDKNTLRYPLQPLYDDLDSSTYETFERDPAKYILYQRAIEEALKNMIKEEEKDTKKLILMVVGAGRGPLIRACLNASVNTNRKIKILAVEKNPNAIVTLSCLIRDLWPDKEIELIAKDMRTIQLEENADILISELLGSFADNELSPECLDGVQHLLKPTGISIPYNSKSYIQPIMTKRTYGQIQKVSNVEDNNNKKRDKYSECTEICWVVYLTNIFHIDRVKELFTFVHPNLDEKIDNSRYEKVSFEASIDCILHGFCGYFSSGLYNDIEISIVPETHTKGMTSWYSAYFPISKPIELKTGDKIEVEFWRKIDTEKVWYEWKVNHPEETIVHNLNGEIHPIIL